MMNASDALVDKIRCISYRGRAAEWKADKSLIEKAVEDAALDRRRSDGSSYIVGCYLWPRDSETEHLFSFTNPDGRAVVRLNGYAIVPIEEFNRLSGDQACSPEPSSSCSRAASSRSSQRSS